MFTGFTWPGHRVTRARSRSRRDSQQPQSTQHRRLLRSSALTLLALGCLLMLPGSSFASEEEAPILFDSDASSALVVEVEQRCSEERLRTIDAEVLWGFDATAKTKAVGLKELRESTEVSIDLTVYPRGFERGDFERIVDEELIRVVDHKNLNVDVEEFAATKIRASAGFDGSSKLRRR